MQGAPNSLTGLLIPVLFTFGVFYFLVIRPQQKKQKEHEAVINSLKKNDEVITNSGIYGTIVNIKEKTFVLRIDDDAKFEIDKSFIMGRKQKDS